MAGEEAARVADEAAHASAAHELHHLSGDERIALGMLLAGAGIAHVWDGDHLIVSASRSAEVEEFVAFMGAEPGEPPADGAGEIGRDEPAMPGPAVAGWGRRFLGYWIDGSLLAVAASSIGLLVGNARQDVVLGALLYAAVFAAYQIPPVAVWGRTAGKLVVGTRIVMLEDGSVPHLSTAAVRWLVAALPELPFLVAPSPAVTLAVLPIVLVASVGVFGGILWHPLSRGLHDRAAGTVVVRA